MIQHCFRCMGMIYSHQAKLTMLNHQTGKIEYRHASKAECMAPAPDKCSNCGQAIDFEYAKNNRVIYHGDVATGITTVQHEKCPVPKAPEPEPKSFTAPKGAT